MGVRRGRMEMQFDLPKAVFVNPEARITYLQHKSNMMRPTFQRMLGEMIQSGLLVKESRFYSLTPKGRDVLKRFQELSEILDRKIQVL